MKQWVGYAILIGIITICWGGGIGIALVSYDKTGVWVSFLVGAIFAAMLGFSVLFELKKFRRRKIVDRDYIEIMTQLVEIETLSEDHYYVHTKWIDPEGGAEHYFKSDYITVNPEKLVNGKPIPVRISRQDHTLYYVDLSFSDQGYSKELEIALGIDEQADERRGIDTTTKIVPQKNKMVSDTDMGQVGIYFFGAFGVAGLASIVTFFITGDANFMIVGLFFNLFWIVVIVLVRKRSAQEDLFYNGKKLLTQIEEVLYQEPINQNNTQERTGFYQIKTSWYDAKSDTIYYFKSQLLTDSPESYLSKIEGIYVYVNAYNFSQNYMDLSFLPPRFNIRRI